jgi:hypothetical protein
MQATGRNSGTDIFLVLNHIYSQPKKLGARRTGILVHVTCTGMMSAGLAAESMSHRLA